MEPFADSHSWTIFFVHFLLALSFRDMIVSNQIFSLFQQLFLHVGIRPFRLALKAPWRVASICSVSQNGGVVLVLRIDSSY
jgi:hypothetical protein